MKNIGLGVCALTFVSSFAPVAWTSGSEKDERRARRRNEVIAPSVTTPLFFVENEGQFRSEVRYQARIPGLTVGVHADGWSLTGETAVRVRFEGATGGGHVRAEERLAGTASYLIGGGAGSLDLHGVSTYQRVVVDELMPGIDLALYARGGRIEYDVRVAPGKPVEDVCFRFEGATSAEITATGGLLVHAGGRELHQRPPVTWQVERDGTRRELRSRFERRGDLRYGFVVEGRDPALPVVIDPVLVYGEFIGGSSADVARSVATDESGNLYVTGWAKSSNFPGSEGTRRGRDAVLFKLDQGRDLAYAIFVGGEGDDVATDVELLPDGSATVVGYTNSRDFPTTTGAFASRKRGGLDGFAFRVTPDGTDLAWSTFVGGGADEVINALALGGDGSAYLVGTSKSSDYPTTELAVQRDYRGGRDAFVTKLDSEGRVLVFSTLLGGVRDDEGNDVGLDAKGNVYVIGSTDSYDFPTTDGAWDDNKAEVDAFVTKLSLAGRDLVYSTYLGGAGQDEALSIAVSPGGEAWVAGWTQSYDYPTTSGALQEENRARRDGFATRVSSSGGSVTYSTYLGGSGTDEVHSVVVDAFGVPWFAGTTGSDDMPVSADAAQEARAGGRDAFLLGIDPGTGRLAFGTYLGSAGHEIAYALAVQPRTQNLVLVGQAEDVVPSERGVLASDRRSPSDAIVARFEPGLCGARAERTIVGAGGGVQLRVSKPRLGWPFDVEIFDGPPNTEGYVLVSPATMTSTIVEDLLELHVDKEQASVLFRFETDENGRWEYETTLPRLGDSCGRTFVVQAITLDAKLGPLSFGQLSQGILLTLGD